MTPPMTRAEIEGVSISLSDDEKIAILHGKCGVPRHYPEWSADCICAASVVESMSSGPLVRARTYFPGGYVLTERGIAVRDFLREGGDGTN